jgi:hypothetical protein
MVSPTKASQMIVQRVLVMAAAPAGPATSVLVTCSSFAVRR